MRLWPFSSKRVGLQAAQTKSASYLFSIPALQQTQVTYETIAADGYGINAAVRGCLEKIVTPMTGIEIRAYVKDKNGKLIETQNHKILELLRKPSPHRSGEDFINWFMRYYLLSGNAYILAPTLDGKAPTKPPSEIYLLRPNSVSVVMGEKAVPRAYRYRTKDGKDVDFYIDQMTGNSAVMHKMTFNPLSEVVGLPPLTAAGFGVDTINEGSRWNLSLLKNGGRPSGALVVNSETGQGAKTLSEEQYLRLKEELDQKWTGASNAGRPLLLEGGLDWKEMSINPKDMDHESTINNAKRDIALAFGVPPLLLGIPGDSTYSNMESAKLALWEDTILPHFGSFLGALNNWLAPLYGDGVQLWYDADTIPALEPRRKALSERVEASTSMTINEKRRILGLDERPDGDVILTDSSKVPLEMLLDSGLSEPGSKTSQTQNIAQ